MNVVWMIHGDRSPGHANDMPPAAEELSGEFVAYPGAGAGDNGETVSGHRSALGRQKVWWGSLAQQQANTRAAHAPVDRRFPRNVEPSQS